MVEHQSDNSPPVGYPALPAKTIRIWVPANAKFKDCGVESSSSVVANGDFRPTYIVPSVRLGDPMPATSPDPDVYSRQEEYPGKKVKYIETREMRGHKMLYLQLSPVSFLPVSRRLITSIEMTIWIDYTVVGLHSTSRSASGNSRLFDDTVRDIVENPDEVQSGLDFTPKYAHDEIRYLIITSSSYANGFAPLAEWKTKKGVPARIVTTQDINASYNGADLQEKMKNCIDDYILRHGTEWVLLGGDVGAVPARMYDVYFSGYSDSTPGDIYYSGDDVFVGRASVTSSSQANTYSRKVLRYEKNAPLAGYTKDLLMTGASMWGTGDVQKFSNRIYDRYIEPHWSPEHMEMFFDTNTGWSGYDEASVKSKINAGWNFINMLCHGSYTHWGVDQWYGYSSDAAASQSNGNELSLIYSGSCSTCAFDDGTHGASGVVPARCLAEAFIRNGNGGAITYIGSSRYSFGNAYDGGPMAKYNQCYFKRIFTDGFYHIGQVYHLHKDCSGGCDWCRKSINLLGDPELPIWTELPQNMEILYPDTGIGIGEQTLTVVVEPDAHVCYLKGSYTDPEVYVHGYADSGGVFSAHINPEQTGTLHITATKHNFDPLEVSASVELIAPLRIETYEMPAGKVGNFYSATLEAAGGTRPYRWTTTTPAGLPPGLSLAAGGELSGTPLTAGAYAFTARVTDDDGESCSKEISITIDEGIPVVFMVYNPDNYDSPNPFAGSHDYAWSDPVTASVDQYAQSPVWRDDFNDTTMVAESTNIDISGGKATLERAVPEITIGSSSYIDEIPLDSSSKYGRCQIIYLQSGIGSAGEISRIRFDKVDSDSFEFKNVTIHMNHTTLSEYTSDEWMGEGQLVFSGDLYISSSRGWHEIELDTPFTYNNTDNLLLSVRHSTGDSGRSISWHATGGMFDPKRCLKGGGSSGEPDLARSSYIPNVQMVMLGSYIGPGSLTTRTVTPDTSMANWGNVSWSAERPAATSLFVQLLHNDGGWTPVPDSALPGNSGGFTNWPVSLSGLATAEYPELRARINFSTSNPAFSPALDSLEFGLVGTRYRCAGWMGTGSTPASGASNSITFTILEDSSITWSWQKQYLLESSVNDPAMGSVSPAGKTWYDEASVTTLTAMSNPGHRFTGWSGDASGTENPLAVAMDSMRRIVANFEEVTGPSPAITLAPASMSFSAVEGGADPGSQTLGVTNSGQGALNWNISDDSGWLSCSPAAGTAGAGATDQVVVSVDVTGLSAGTYNGVMTVYDPNASNSPRTCAVTLVVSEGPPVAGFTATPTSGIRPLTVSFTDTSTGAITNRYWSFGDGGTSGQQNPVNTYYSTGTYTVSLTVSGPGGSDTRTIPGFISVEDPVPLQVTVTSDPAGMTVTVDGVDYMAPETFSWTSGESHTIGVFSPQGAGPGTRYVHDSWSDGGSMTHEIVVSSAITSYTAYMRAQYELSTSVSGNGEIIRSPDSIWYDASTQVQLTAVADNGYEFIGWSGDLSGSANPDMITMNGPKSVTAVFGEMQPGILVTPGILDFGSVSEGTTRDLAFTVANTGGGTLTGNASGLFAPFSLVGSASYSLKTGQTAIVTVRFAPDSIGNFSDTVSFSGGGGASAAVSGTGTSGAVTNVALNQPARASSHYSGYVASNANDSDAYTYWRGDTLPEWWSVDLGGTKSISFIKITFWKGPEDFKVQSSDDAIAWTDQIVETDNGLVTWEKTVDFSARYVRIYTTRGYLGVINSVRIHNCEIWGR